MGFLKKNVFLFACLGIILAGGGIFAFSMMKQKSNQEELKKLSTLCNGVNSLGSQVVYDAELKKLEEIANQAKSAQQTAINKAIQTSRRNLLSSQVFPNLKNSLEKDIHFQEFARNYVAFIDGLLVDLKAGENLSAEQTQAIRDRYLKTAEGTTSENSDQKQQDHIQMLIAGERKDHAEKISVYADHFAFCGYYHWKTLPTGTEDELLYDSWLTQVAAWVQQDVVQSIKQLNSSAESVVDAPVKRLVSIGFGGGSFLTQPTRQETLPVNNITGIQRAPGSEYFLPAYVTQNKIGRAAAAGATEAAFQNEMVTPYTGNACNDEIDVIHFSLEVIADSEKINELINVLQSPKFELDDTTQTKNNERNQITVLGVNIDPVNIQAELDSGFYYGRADAKLLTIICEYFFFKSGYESENQNWIPRLVADVRDGVKPSPAPSRATFGTRPRGAGSGRSVSPSRGRSLTPGRPGAPGRPGGTAPIRDEEMLEERR
ncbi:MAG: hypothetical protein JXD22_09700 [Sedimentisphaerales bacterium]|nr:hypothetical protein [Sedimentisphaerales bacterium]